MTTTTDRSGIRIEIAENEWPYLRMYPKHFLRAWNAILPVQTAAFVASGLSQVFVLREPWAGSPFSTGLSGQHAVHVNLSSTSGIEGDLPELTASIYSAIGSNDELSFSYESPKGSLQPDEWLYVLIDCAKEAGKILAAIAAKAIFDYYRNKRTKSKEDARVVVLYGPRSEVYKKFTVEGDGEGAKVADEDDSFKFPDHGTFS
jgi:hypothetical protein